MSAPAAGLAAVLDAAARAEEPLATAEPAERAAWLTAVADAIDAAADDLVPLAREETHLGAARLRGEVTRTTFQLRFFARVTGDGGFLRATVDAADPEWPMGPRPDIRRMGTALGTTLVYTASNFPFAFGVAGGDTASALAAGCPVVVKAHEGHPRLSDALGKVTAGALAAAGAPRGMTPEIVNYFTSRGIRVMLSIGGITYTDAWNRALAENPAQLGLNAAAVAGQLGVGIEIDYEENTSPDLTGLQAFIDAYRSVHPYDASGAKPAARLTIDTAAGDRWLIGINRKATADWLRPDRPVLDYANAMVPARQPSVDGAIANWQEHVDGKPQYSPPVPPLAPAKFTGGLYIGYGNRILPECNDFAASLQRATGDFVQNVAPNGAGTSSGMLGYMFWAAEKPSVRGLGTQPPNTCEGGVGAGAAHYGVPVPMPPLRQG